MVEGENMEAIRTIKKVVNHQLLIDLPDSFEEKEVEVIIFPINGEPKPTKLSELLLKGPVWSEDDISNFETDMQRGYTKWKINGF